MENSLEKELSLKTKPKKSLTPEEAKARIEAARKRRQKRVKINKSLLTATLTDNELMQLMLSRTSLVQNMLKAFLEAAGINADHLQIVNVDTQKNYYFTYKGRTLRFDVYAEDILGRRFNLEVQRRTEDAPPSRATHHYADIEVGDSLAGDSFKDERDIFVIFFFEKDPFKAGLPVYLIEPTITNLDNQPFDSNMHILYVNGEFKDTTSLVGKYIHDFHCSNHEDMFIPEMADAMKHYKTTKEGKKELTDLIQRNFAEEIEEVRAETRAEVLAEEQKKRNNERREMARNLAEKAKWSYEKIAEYMNTTLDEIKALLTPRK